MFQRRKRLIDLSQIAVENRLLRHSTQKIVRQDIPCRTIQSAEDASLIKIYFVSPSVSDEPAEIF